MTDGYRAHLANLLAGREAQSGACSAEEIAAWLACARSEGVVALASARLDAGEGVDPSLRLAFRDAARELAAEAMLREAECRKVLSLLAAGQVECLLLKGLALGAWLYPAGFLRESSDIDLLFRSRTGADRAVQLLARAGYLKCFDPGDMAHEFSCQRSGSATASLDLHWRLTDLTMFSDAFSFDELRAGAIALPRLGHDGRGLGAVHAFLHACIHRVSNLSASLGDRLKWLYDLHLLGLHLDDAGWQALGNLAIDRGMAGLCCEAIDASAAAFGSVAPPVVMAALSSARSSEALDAHRMDDWLYMQRANLMALPTLGQRMRWLRQRALPSSDYLRVLYGSQASVARLWLQRLRRGLTRLG